MTSDFQIQGCEDSTRKMLHPVAIETNDYKIYDLNVTSPRDIIKAIQKSYSSGILENRNELKENMDITNEVQRAVDNVMKNKSKYKNQDDLESGIYSAIANCFSGMHGVTRTTSDMIDDVYEKELKRVGLNAMNETVDISKFNFTNYSNPDGQSHPNCKTYRSTLEYMASETERLFNNALHTYWGETEPYKQLTISYMNLNRHSCTRDLVGAGAEQGLKDAQSAIFKRQGELLELSKQFTKWNGKEWVKSGLTESNELEQRAKKHKKKSKGMGWHMSFNAGDVDTAIDVFNNSTSLGNCSGEGTAMGESVEQNTYYYDGPIYYDGRKIASKSDIYTTAKSSNLAIRNILYKAANGDKELYHYDIVDDMVKEIPKEDRPKVRPKCQTCGYTLNDIGDCPVCDYGEDDLLESLTSLEALWQLGNID